MARTPTPCRDSFDVVALALKGIKDGIWPAAKERVRLAAARDRRLTAADQAVLSVYMAKNRRSTGDVRLTIAELAAAAGDVEPTIRRALKHLIEAGCVLPRQ
ncbi:MAG TPA: hypothetical protein VFX46_00715, partial [Hyphomicrobiaceae bacterium]|nr:hypothetical protein [Hyphomicrobiaceae bacterium]